MNYRTITTGRTKISDIQLCRRRKLSTDSIDMSYSIMTQNLSQSVEKR